MLSSHKLKTALVGGVCAMALATGAAAQSRTFNVPAGDLQAALDSYAQQAGVQLLYRVDLVRGVQSRGAQGELSTEGALALVLADTGLQIRRHESGAVAIVQAGEGGADPQRPGAPGASSTVEALIVTAQKREEDIQDVPIAISAFSAEKLDAMKIEGGFDLLKAIPNVAFTKTNFTSYNFQIRGVGTQSISATSDPGVAVSFNNSAIIQNRLFEQEYLDIERVEVLRGPQGTLYGRNATAGVINVISAKPRMGQFLGEIKGEVGNYNTYRLRGMLNVPIGDTFAIRAAAAWTDRDGYTFNSGTGHQVDGRQLWTSRLTLGWEPDPRLRADLIWEHFEEDDDRLRTGKQLCHRDDGPDMVGDVDLADGVVGGGALPGNTLEERYNLRRATFGQGCQPGSLYADEAFGTPNGLSYNFVLGNLSIVTFYGLGQIGSQRFRHLEAKDPYGGKMQSRDLREIESIRDPVYRAKADLLELNFDFDITDALQFSSQTLYVNDETYSFQDFNRFNTEPIFQDTSLWTPIAFATDWSGLAPGGVFCDPQIGCSDSIAGFDISQASAEQFGQEFRLQSSFEGPVNFSIGANYTKFDALVDYYVFFNLLTAMARTPPFNQSFDPSICINPGSSFVEAPQSTYDDIDAACPYIDPQPIDTSRNFEGDGHNYFRSKNPYELESLAGFGELYWNIRDDLKLTAGARYTDDRKIFTVVPSQVLLAPGVAGGGVIAKGYPVRDTIEQQWGEWTGRLVLDWQPELSFTNETMIYGSIAHGYKGGGANPPTPDFADETYFQGLIERGILGEAEYDFLVDFGIIPQLELTAVEYGPTFDPEYVDAYEVGTKNTLLDGAMTFNATAFYYDYTDYQVSQIRDRTAVNENFDAEMWGLEFEGMFAPSRDLQIIANVGYLNTRIADGETSIDLMNRTQGDPNYTLVKPWAQLPSNCVVPTNIAEIWAENYVVNVGYFHMCGLGGTLGFLVPNEIIDPQTGEPYDPLATDDDGNLLYPELNGGGGLLADLSGNELPNSPHWTANIGGQYTFHLPDEWDLVVRGDAYWQSQSYHRIYNTEPYDKLRGWYNANLVVWAENDELGLKIEGYVKNLLNNDPITGAFLNSDDTGLTTNVFMLDPRLYGISIRKSF